MRLLASERLVVLDQLRVPYGLVATADSGAGGVADPFPLSGWALLRQTDRADPPSLHWPSDGSLPARAAGLNYIEGIPFFAAVVPDAQLAALATRHGWARGEMISDALGKQVASVWREPDGSVVLPFDPNEAIRGLLMERYRDAGRNGTGSQSRRVAVKLYYRFRPLLPRPLQLAMRRLYSRVQARTQFPRWPYEPALHDLIRRLYQLVAEITDSPPPWIAPWPEPYSWALVLTHDVETEVGYRKMPELCALEEELGYRSSWNFVARRYTVDDDRVQELIHRGFEVGIHGLHHDGRDLESNEMIQQRLPAIRAYADRWGAVGFRSPATQRNWEWMGLLGFDYDSSFPDTDPYEPQPGGSCSWLPFFIDDMVELPITLPQDHTLFVILRQKDAVAWIEKANLLRERGGMALMLTHPDYLTDDATLERYVSMLQEFRDDASAWRVLPREVAAWWRRRAASHLESDGGRWRVVGPAAGDAAIVTGPPR